MCLGVPAKIIERFFEDPQLIPAKADFGGICKTIYLCFTPEATVGDYVLVHVGFAISLINETRARELLTFLDQAYGGEYA